MGCLIITEEIKELAKKFPNETPETIKGLISLWQEDNGKLLDDYPSFEELSSYITRVRESNEENQTQVDKIKELMDESLYYPEIKTPTILEKQQKLDLIFTSQTRRDRVSLIGKFFELELKRAVNEKIDEINQSLENTDSDYVRDNLQAQLASVDEMYILNELTPLGVFERVKDIFKSYVEASNEDRINSELTAINAQKGAEKYSDEKKLEAAKQRAEHKYIEYQKVLDNFDLLAQESVGYLAYSTGIRIDIETMAAEELELEDTYSENGEIVENPDDPINKEELVKESYISSFRKRSSRDTLSKEVRKIISTVPKYNYDKTLDKDDLGNIRYLDPEYVHAFLIDKLKDIVDSEDMMDTLKSLSETTPWVKLLFSKIEKDPTLRTKFFVDFNKDFASYWIQAVSRDEEGVMSVKTVALNKPEGIKYLLDEWRLNYESGNQLDEDSVYNKDHSINKENAKKGLALVEELNNTFSNLENSEKIELLNNPEVFNKILKALNMIGINANADSLKKALSKSSPKDSIFKSVSPIIPLLSDLNVIFSSIVKNKVQSNNEYSSSVDLINEFSGVYSNIANLINEVTTDAIESSIVENGASYYAHNTPNYLGKLMKLFKLKNKEKFIKFIEDNFKKYDWFYKNGKWRSDWIQQLVESDKMRAGLEHKILLFYDKKSYSDWDELDYLNVLLNEYWSADNDNNSSTKWAYYYVPIMSDSPTSEFIKFRRYVDNVEFDEEGNPRTYKDILLDKFTDLINQEYDRITLVKKRDKVLREDPKLKPIENFDILDSKDGIGGAEFKFLPMLNTLQDSEGELFLDKMERLLEEGDGTALKKHIRDSIESVMNYSFEDFISKSESLGLFEETVDGVYKYLPFRGRGKEESARKALEEYFWNSSFATSQIIEMTTGDSVFYGNTVNFQKRFKEVHSPSQKVDTYAQLNGETVGKEYERVIYIKDDIVESPIIPDIEEIFNDRIAKGFMTEAEKNDIIAKYKEVNVADGQSYRTMKSSMAVAAMLGEVTPELQKAYDRIMSGKYTAADIYTFIAFKIRKPFAYSQIPAQSHVEGFSEIKVPTQHKNSEFTLLSLYGAIAGPVEKFSKLAALDKFMDENNIDVAHFQSVVKVGSQGLIDLSKTKGYKDTLETLNNTFNTSAQSDIIHEIPFSDYGDQTALPPHYVDTTIYVGSQGRKLIAADLTFDSVEINGRSYKKDEWFNLYDEILTENVYDSAIAVTEIFSSKKNIEKVLMEELKSNPRYSSDLIRACTLDKDGKFVAPLFDPTTSQLQSLLLSIIRNRITKQKIKGGSLVQVSCFGSKDLHIKFEGEGENKRIKYMECYMPAYSKKFFDHFLDPVTKTININDLPKSLRKVVGYRIPTEDKYSMLPLYIKDFLPASSGTAIMIPEELTTIAGFDFDGDKLYIMLPEFNIIEYDSDKAKEAFKEEVAVDQEILDAIFGEEDIENAPITYKEWFDINKERFRLTRPKAVKIKYNPNKPASEQSIKARNNMIIDMYYSVLTSPEMASSILSSGGYDTHKKAARIIDILKGYSEEELKEILEVDNTENIISKLEGKSLSELNKLTNKLYSKINPLSPLTQVYFHKQNMTGAALLPIYANNNSHHAIAQHSSLRINPGEKFTLNGKSLTSLHNIYDSENRVISKTNAGYLAASADNAKDPILASLHQNLFTVNSSTILSRLGYSPLEVGLFMSQPIIEDIVKEYSRKFKSGATKLDIIDSVIEKYKERGESIDSSSYDDFKSNAFLIKDLAGYLLDAKEAASISSKSETQNYGAVQFYAKQVSVGMLFKHIFTLGELLGDQVRINKPDTSNGGTGATITDTEAKIRRVDKFYNKMSSPSPKLEGYDLVENMLPEKINEPIMEVLKKVKERFKQKPVPFIQAFHTYGLELPILLLADEFPQSTRGFRKVMDDLSIYLIKDDFDPKTSTKISQELLTYIAFQSEFLGSDSRMSAQQKREYFINEFPNEFQKIVAQNPDIASLGLIQRLKVIKPFKSDLANKVIMFKNVGSLNTRLKENYGRDWAYLLSSGNPVANKLALDLFRYSIYRNGLGFGPNSFIHLAPVMVKMAIPEYRESLYSALDPNKTYDEFVLQFLRNHLNSREFTRELSEDVSIEFTDSEGNIKDTIDVTEFDIKYNTSNREFAKSISYDGEISFYRLISKKINDNYVYYIAIPSSETSNSISYERIEPLGSYNQFLEYEYGTPADLVESVIKIRDNSEMEADSDLASGASFPYDISDAMLEQMSRLEGITENESYGEVIREDFPEGTTSEILDFNTLEGNNDFRDANDRVTCRFTIK